MSSKSAAHRGMVELIKAIWHWLADPFDSRSRCCKAPVQDDAWGRPRCQKCGKKSW